MQIEKNETEELMVYMAWYVIYNKWLHAPTKNYALCKAHWT